MRAMLARLCTEDQLAEVWMRVDVSWGRRFLERPERFVDRVSCTPLLRKSRSSERGWSAPDQRVSASGHFRAIRNETQCIVALAKLIQGRQCIRHRHCTGWEVLAPVSIHLVCTRWSPPVQAVDDVRRTLCCSIPGTISRGQNRYDICSWIKMPSKMRHESLRIPGDRCTAIHEPTVEIKQYCAGWIHQSIDCL